MLSGFSLAYVYAEKDFTDYKNLRMFYKKRLWGILPLYYFVSVIYVIFLDNTSLLQKVMIAPAEILGIQSAFPDTFSISHNGGTWFISCILFCYFVFPGMMSVFEKINEKKKRTFLGVIVLILLYAPLLVAGCDLGGIYSNPFFRILEFALGVLLELIMNAPVMIEKTSRLQNGWIVLVEFLILVLGVSMAVRLGIAPGNYMLYSWIGIPVFACMLISLSKSSIVWKLNPITQLIRGILFMSDISYAVFLAQFFVWPLERYILKLTGICSNGVKICLAVILCMLLAISMYFLVEKPVKAIERKFSDECE